jgi:hypothetical protein
MLKACNIQAPGKSSQASSTSSMSSSVLFLVSFDAGFRYQLILAPSRLNFCHVSQKVFQDTVEEGFQATTTWHQGAIRDAPGTCPGDLPATVPCAKWAFNVRPVYGWGESGYPQRSTARWLSSLPVFEPHWQVLMAHGK